MKKNTCYVLESGWIIIGTEEKRDSEQITLKCSSVVRKWTNGKGIGGIAKAENKDEYTLDSIGDCIIRLNKVLFEIPCEW